MRRDREREGASERGRESEGGSGREKERGGERERERQRETEARKERVHWVLQPPGAVPLDDKTGVEDRCYWQAFDLFRVTRSQKRELSKYPRLVVTIAPEGPMQFRRRRYRDALFARARGLSDKENPFDAIIIVFEGKATMRSVPLWSHIANGASRGDSSFASFSSLFFGLFRVGLYFGGERG